MFKRWSLIIICLTIFSLTLAAQVQRPVAGTSGSLSVAMAVVSVETVATRGSEVDEGQLPFTLPAPNLRRELLSLGLPMGGQYVCSGNTPLNCHNGYCCPPGYTLQCPHSTCDGVPDGMNGCYNPNKLTADLLAALRNCCPGLVACS